MYVRNNEEGGFSSGVRLPYGLLLTKAGGLQKRFKEPQQHHKAPRGWGLPSRGQGGRASGERGRVAGVATLIRIYFQPGPWNSFVPVTGLRFPLALIPACLTPVGSSRAGNSATGMPLYLQSSPL